MVVLGGLRFLMSEVTHVGEERSCKRVRHLLKDRTVFWFVCYVFSF